jgi:hypothetical protein
MPHNFDDSLAERLAAASLGWPTITQTNPHDCPRIREARELRSLVDTNAELSKEVVERAEELEAQSEESCSNCCTCGPGAE